MTKKKLTNFFLPIFFLGLFTCLIFFKIFTIGRYPVPADLLVSFYFPWYAGGWQGYSPWTTHKELLNADAIRQIYLWKEFALNQFKNGSIPLWNPYTFSGQPLAANFQSGVFYPLNLFYLITTTINAWILLIIIQPLLGGLFMYLASRSFKLSKAGSYFAATSFMFSSYMISWLENGNIGHSYIWLPLSIWSINEFIDKKKYRYFLSFIISLSASILAGHPQTTIYIFITVVLYFIFKIHKNIRPFKFSIYLVASIITALGISAIQLILTVGFYKDSPVALPFSKEIFLNMILPYKNLITFFASDFFGHPAANNYWSFNYGDFTPYIGVLPIVFALWALYVNWNKKQIRFFLFIIIIFILAAVRGPITFLIQLLKIPVLDSTTPSRFLSISIFFLTLLSGFGFEDIINNCSNKKYFKKLIFFIGSIGIIYIFMWSFALFAGKILSPKIIWEVNTAVTRHNLILPTLMFLMIPITLILSRLKLLFKIRKIILMISFFSVLLVGGLYYSNKFLPTAPKQFIFPKHPVFDYLRNNGELNRFFGLGTAHFDNNMTMHYEIYGLEGYDTLRLKRYAELLASSFTGSVPENYHRSDASLPQEESDYSRRLLNLTGTKYFVDKKDNPQDQNDSNIFSYHDNVKLIWSQDKFRIYERGDAIPRYFLTTNFEVIVDKNNIIDKIFNQNFDLKTLILEKQPNLEIKKNEIAVNLPKLIKYEPNKSIIGTNAPVNTLLFLSDAYTDDWKVFIDGNQSELLRAQYAFRAVAVPSGNHQIVFEYRPKYFNLGLIISLFSIMSLLIFSLIKIKNKQF